MEQAENRLSPRGNLLEAGRELFAAKGFNGTSVRDIARKACTNVSMISYYFGGKEQLYSQIVEGFAESIRSLFAPENVADLTSHERVRYYVKNVMAMHQDNPQLARILHHEMNSPTPVLEELRTDLFPHVFGFLYKTFDEGIRSGQFRSDLDPVAMTYSLASLVNFYHFQKSLILRMNPAFGRQGTEIIDRALDIFFDGVNPPPGGDDPLED